MKAFMRAASIVSVSMIIGYEFGLRKWEHEHQQETARKVRALRDELNNIREWAYEECENIEPSEFCVQMRERLRLVDLFSRHI